MKQVLSVEQMKHLQELGLDTSDASMCWCRAISHKSVTWELEIYEYVINQKLRAIPIIERGLEANKAYVRMLDEMSAILEKYCEEWEDLGMRHTFMQRVPHECWQGRFSRHSQNPEQKPNYS